MIDKIRGLPIFQGGKDDEPPAPAADDPPEPEGSTDTFTIDDIKELRAEAKKWRLKLREAEGKNQEYADKMAKLDKLEATLKKLTGGEGTEDNIDEIVAKHEKEKAELRANAEKALLKSAFIAEAAKNNIIDPNRVFKMIDAADDRLTIDLNTGEVEGIADVVTELIKEAPYLMKADGQAPPATTDIKAPGSQPPKAVDRPANKDEAITAAFEKAKETGSVRGAMDFLKAKREAAADG